MQENIKKEDWRHNQIDASEHLKRMNLVIKLKLSGMTTKQVAEWVNSDQYDKKGEQIHKAWNLRDRAIREYVQGANEYITRKAHIDRDHQIGLALMQYQDLYRLNYNSENLQECRNIVKDRTNLLGLAAAEKLDVTTAGASLNKYEGLSHEDLVKLAGEMGFERK